MKIDGRGRSGWPVAMSFRPSHSASLYAFDARFCDQLRRRAPLNFSFRFGVCKQISTLPYEQRVTEPFKENFLRMAGGWHSLSFRLSHFLGAASSGASRRHASAHGDAVLGDDGLPAKPRKSARFPLKAALTASVLATAGDTVAQLLHRSKQRKALQEQEQRLVEGVDGAPALVTQAADGVSLWDHDWKRAARMASYGFLIYGPLSQFWYEVLDHFMPLKNLTNLSLKVVANQVILGPIVITLVFAWNKLWEGRLEQLPELYRTRALQTLLDGWKFWIPASVLNFGVIPLQARVAFMSSCSIFWNFYLSNTMTAGKAKALLTSKSE